MMLLFGPIGPEVLIIILILILLFGANRVPKLANSVGESISEFKKGRKESLDDEKENVK